MGKLRVLSGREVCKILVQNQEVLRRGSHIVTQRRFAGSTITVPMPDDAELRIGTLISIIRQSQLPRSLY